MCYLLDLLFELRICVDHDGHVTVVQTDGLEYQEGRYAESKINANEFEPNKPRQTMLDTS